MTLILSGTNGVSDVDGSASTPAIRGSDTNTGIFFPAADTIAFAEGGAEVARFDSSGNFGIGTSSPSYKLDVSGANPRMRIQPTTGTEYALYQAQNTGGSAFIGLENSAGSALSTGAAYSLNIYHGGAYPILFSTNANERARIDSSGRLLVNTTSGTANALFQVSSNGTKQSFQVFNNDNVQLYSLGTGTVYSNGGVFTNTNPSDERLKENISELPFGLSQILALRPVSYTWKNDKINQGTQYGFIAQEVQPIIPDLVREFESQEGEETVIRFGLEKEGIYAAMVKAIQEQQALINDLTARIAALEAA